ncbi:MAG: 5-formyltetrahydrofolate cyclo-ligase [Pseudomonadota bacterium]
MTKSDIRKKALLQRDATAPDWRAAQAEKLAIFADALALAPGALVSGFLPIRSEIDVQPLMASLHLRGHGLCLPVVLDRETIIFRRYAPSMALIDTGFGTRGPGAEAEQVDPDVMLMPLAAFDARGNRLGYGAGHYDRAIARLNRSNKRPQLIGCAFACQGVALIPAEAHDVPLDAILTEEGITHFQPRP